jgi:hypothetical protein
MFCGQCGSPVLDGAPFCSRCGTAAGSGPSLIPGASSSALVRRVVSLLRSPATEWHAVAAEPSTAGGLYLRYAAPLIAIGVVANFIGQSLVGMPFVGRVSVGAALVHAMSSYALSFAGVYAIALIVDMLAPAFGGRRHSLAALKVTVYSFTPAWLAGAFNVIPILSVLAIVGALYGLYLLYLGLPALMRCPPDKSTGYTIVTVLCAIVTWVLIALVSSCLLDGLGLVGARAAGRLAS